LNEGKRKGKKKGEGLTSMTKSLLLLFNLIKTRRSRKKGGKKRKKKKRRQLVGNVCHHLPFSPQELLALSLDLRREEEKKKKRKGSSGAPALPCRLNPSLLAWKKRPAFVEKGEKKKGRKRRGERASFATSSYFPHQPFSSSRRGGKEKKKNHRLSLARCV